MAAIDGPSMFACIILRGKDQTLRITMDGVRFWTFDVRHRTLARIHSDFTDKRSSYVFANAIAGQRDSE
jgi:hypothetical protein